MNKSFTLIEILTVILIVGVLSGIIIVATNSVIDSTQDAKRKKDLDSISKVLMEYGIMTGSYPVEASECNIGDGTCLDELIDTGYTKNFPLDPFGSRYKYTSDGTTYTIKALLSDNQTLAYNPDTGYSEYQGLVGYTKRKSITVSNSGSTLTNYQMKFTVYRSTGTDSGFNVYVGTNCQEDYDDIRFTNSSNAVLDYWIESSDASSATIWVKADSLASGNTTMYLYYANASATSVSNGDNTFEFFDDFEDGDVNDWTFSSENVHGASLTADNTIKKQGLYSLRIYGYHSPGYNWITSWAQASKIITLSTGTKVVTLWHRSDVCGSYPEYNTVYINGSAVLGPTCPGTTFTLANTSAFTNSGSVTIALRTHRYAISFDFVGNFDPVFIRNYTVTEPSVSSWGSEESI